MAKIIWSRQADLALQRIYSHIADNFTVDLAESFYFEVISSCEKLLKLPLLGRISRKYVNVREYIFKGNTIYYEVMGKNIRIITIRPRKTKEKP